MSALDDFRNKSYQRARDNLTGKTKAGKAFGALFGAGILLEIAQADGALNKLKATMVGLFQLTTHWSIIAVGGFSALTKGVRSALIGTGALEAAMRRLGEIRAFEKAFAPFVGGIAAAKAKIADLAAFSDKTKFSFPDVAQGAHALESKTGGSFGNAEDLSTVNRLAEATGNSFSDTAGAIGDFYAAVKSGGNVSGATDQLREMGLVTRSAADDLALMQERGESNEKVLSALRPALAAAGAAMGAFSGNIEDVNKAYEKAKDNLAQGFAAPFTKAETENTGNLAEAYKNLTPAVSTLGSFLQILTGGFSTAATAVIKFISGNKALVAILEGLVVVISVAITALSGIAAVALASWLLGAGAAISTLVGSLITLTGATGVAEAALYSLGAALNVVAIASGVLLIVAALVTLAGIAGNIYTAVNRSSDAIKASAEAHKKATAEIQKHIDAIKNLADRHNALREALDGVVGAQKELDAALAAGEKNRIEEAQKNVKDKQEQFENANKTGKNLPKDDGLNDFEKQTEKELAGKSKEERQLIISRKIKEFGEKQASASQLAPEPPSLLHQLTHPFENLPDIDDPEHPGKKIPQVAPKGFFQHLKQFFKPHGLRDSLQDPYVPVAPEPGPEAKDAAARKNILLRKLQPTKEERELDVERNQQDRGLERHRRERVGDFRGAIELSDLDAFSERFESNKSRGFKGDELQSRSLAQAQDEIAQSVTGRSPVVDSLQRIGGGGNIGGSDPMLEIARRQEDLLRDSVKYLAIISEEKGTEAGPGFFSK